MNKNELLKLLEDPDVVVAIRNIMKGKRIITRSDVTKLTKLVKWWVNETGNPHPKLDDFSRSVAIGHINKLGIPALEAAFREAKILSLSYEKSHFMHDLFNDFMWCIKSHNVEKIMSGKYKTKSAMKFANDCTSDVDFDNKIFGNGS